MSKFSKQVGRLGRTKINLFVTSRPIRNTTFTEIFFLFHDGMEIKSKGRIGIKYPVEYTEQLKGDPLQACLEDSIEIGKHEISTKLEELVPNLPPKLLLENIPMKEVSLVELVPYLPDSLDMEDFLKSGCQEFIEFMYETLRIKRSIGFERFE